MIIFKTKASKVSFILLVGYLIDLLLVRIFAGNEPSLYMIEQQMLSTAGMIGLMVHLITMPMIWKKKTGRHERNVLLVQIAFFSVVTAFILLFLIV